MTANAYRLFQGLCVGLSFAPSNFPEDHDEFSERSASSLLFNQASYILFEGGRLVLGQRWKPEGVLDYLASRARTIRIFQSSVGPKSVDKPPILNILRWRDTVPPETDTSAQKMISEGILVVKQIPPENIDVTAVDPETQLGKFCRIRALSAMRKAIVEESDLRICLGGARLKPENRLPGCVEEAYFAIQSGKPFYISSSCGGASRLVVDAMLQRRLTDESRQQFATSIWERELMESFQAEFPYPAEEGPCVIDEDPGYCNVLDFFQTVDLNRLAENSFLGCDEYINLMTTPDINRVMMHVSNGVARMQKQRVSEEGISPIEGVKAPGEPVV